MKSQLIITPEQSEEKLRDDIAEAHRRHARRLLAIERAAEAAPALDQSGLPNGERYRTALKLRRSGKTFREVGEALGVTAGRASQMCSKAERMEREPKSVSGLSTRAYNAIVNALGSRWDYRSKRELDPNVVAEAFTLRSLTEMPNCGRRTANEIVYWLHTHGRSISKG